MYNVSQAYQTAVVNPTRTFTYEVKVNGQAVTSNELVDFS